MMRLLPCCVVALAACTPKPAPTTPRDPSTSSSSIASTTSTPATETTTETKPPATEATPPVSNAGDAVHCLFVEPEHRVVRCYWKRDECDRQLEFNKKLVENQKCEGFAQAYCFDERGQKEACYPTAADCDETVAKMKQRNRPVSACTAKRGP